MGRAGITEARFGRLNRLPSLPPRPLVLPLKVQSMKRSLLTTPWLSVFSVASLFVFVPTVARAVDLVKITPTTAPTELAGKEPDWIYGDTLLRNEHLLAVIAAPIEGRNANMTTGEVGAGIIDLTLRAVPNDQLTAYFPAAGQYRFHDPQLVEQGTLAADGTESLSNEDVTAAAGVFWRCTSTAAVAGDGTTAVVTYRLLTGAPCVEVEVAIQGDAAGSVTPQDGVRADRTFHFTAFPEGGPTAAMCEDRFFRQTIGFEVEGTTPTWGKGRLRPLRYQADGGKWSLRLYPATSPLDLASVLAATPERPATLQRLNLTSPLGGVSRALLRIAPVGVSGSEAWNDLYADDEGIASVRLVSGAYEVQVTAPGHDSLTLPLKVDSQAAEHALSLPAPSALQATITDIEGQPIPCKLTIYGRDGTPDPDFGPDSAAGAIRNCVYCPQGTALRSLDAGRYEVIASRGPEHDALFTTVTIEPGKTTPLTGKLNRSVDTTGWVSAELHSHSSPSGDNTSDQRGRVENLVCEHLEFAPCTEHNRIDSYQPHIEALGVEAWLATCTGIEVTGSPLPVNHQNAFPLHHHPHTQDGGGPRTDTNPIVQIERLAMWDDGAAKVVQGNHPNIHQIYGDRDTDGIADEGFRAMFGFMDVIEVHPLESIFEVPENAPAPRDRGNRIFRWMKLLNDGYRIPGVVNTDAHYNHHGSGWLRNWFESSTDDPAKIDVAEMVHVAEHGHIIMSTGPFMEVALQEPASPGDVNATPQRAIPGEDLSLGSDTAELHVKVQCPNWLDINRVQVFVNGRMLPEHDYRRRTHADRFGDGVVKFEQTLPLRLTADAHVIVAAIGEGLSLGRVMGPQFGELPPVVVSNPIYVDRDGNGFQSNGDDLGIPLPKTEATFRPDQSQLPTPPPADAIVLFDGATNRFVSKEGQAVDWPIVEGALVSSRGNTRSNHLCSTELFRDAEIHAEFMLPDSGTGNSGLYLHGHYELQILNSAGKRPTMDHAGAVYGFYAPLVDAAKSPGEWQVYDIRYHAPRRDAQGKITTEGRITAWLNGQLVQDDVRVGEPRSKYHPFRYRTTDYLRELAQRQAATSLGPLFLQDHDNAVKFRNVWIRKL